MQFVSRLEESHNRLWGAHIRVPKSIGKKFLHGNSRRVVCTLNDTREFQCALIPRSDGSYLITINKQLRQPLHVEFGMTIRVRLRKDESKYGLPMPEELNELFRQDPKGSRLFHALTPGRQRTLLYIIGQARNSDNKSFRAVTVVRHLETNNGKINYKALTVELRRR